MSQVCLHVHYVVWVTMCLCTTLLCMAGYCSHQWERRVEEKTDIHDSHWWGECWTHGENWCKWKGNPQGCLRTIFPTVNVIWPTVCCQLLLKCLIATNNYHNRGLQFIYLMDSLGLQWAWAFSCAHQVCPSVQELSKELDEREEEVKELTKKVCTLNVCIHTCLSSTGIVRLFIRYWLVMLLSPSLIPDFVKMLLRILVKS